MRVEVNDLLLFAKIFGCGGFSLAGTGWAVFPGRRLMPAKTRVFLDMMVT